MSSRLARAFLVLSLVISFCGLLFSLLVPHARAGQTAAEPRAAGPSAARVPPRQTAQVEAQARATPVWLRQGQISAPLSRPAAAFGVSQPISEIAAQYAPGGFVRRNKRAGDIEDDSKNDTNEERVKPYPNPSAPYFFLDRALTPQKRNQPAAPVYGKVNETRPRIARQHLSPVKGIVART